MRIDERDVIFSRMRYKAGSDEYNDYYSDKPEQKQIDDEFRKKRPVNDVDSMFYDRINSSISDACFDFLEMLTGYVDGEVSPDRVNAKPELFTKRIKGLAKYFNARLVGITSVDPAFYYSHKGRPAKLYGKKTEPEHNYAIVFAVEMERDMIFRAPSQSEAVAVTKGYIDAAVIGMVLSYYIRSLGYRARNHMDGSYAVVAPLVAKAAGLGDIGRNGLLVTSEYGPRVRLGVVTTDMPLLTDKPKDYGITKLCEICDRCISACPAKAIPTQKKTESDGTVRWQIDSDKCFANWQKIGTDCGICLAACPLSDKIPDHLRYGLKDADIRTELLQYHKNKYKSRPYIKGDVDWMDH